MSNGLNYSPEVWRQLKALTAKDLIRVLKNDSNWEFIKVRKNKYVFYNPNLQSSQQEILIHYHPKKGGYGVPLLKSILNSTNWSEQDLKDLKLIK